jgi:hypothetical protein
MGRVQSSSLAITEPSGRQMAASTVLVVRGWQAVQKQVHFLTYTLTGDMSVLTR